MKRIILDTSAYGKIIIDKQSDLIKEKLKRLFLTYGNNIIKSELRKSPRKKDEYTKNLRMDLLRVYRDLIKRELEITKTTIEIAENYYTAYREFKGNRSHKDMINDLKIVACASLHNLDIVVSHDTKSMLSESAIKSYKLVNEIKKLRTPEFITYEKFKRWLL